LFKVFACLAVIFWSPWISLAKRSHLGFALVVFFLCAGEELLPLSDDAVEGCQWKAHNGDGWTPYWDPQP
jgi:hypothetical protein